MLQSRVGCSCSTGAIPVGLLAMDPDGADLGGEILDAGRLLADVPEVELHPNEIGERRPVDDDSRRSWRAAVALVPLEPEEDVVPAPRAVVTVVAERQAQSGCVLAADEGCTFDRGG